MLADVSAAVPEPSKLGAAASGERSPSSGSSKEYCFYNVTANGAVPSASGLQGGKEDKVARYVIVVGLPN